MLAGFFIGVTLGLVGILSLAHRTRDEERAAHDAKIKNIANSIYQIRTEHENALKGVDPSVKERLKTFDAWIADLQKELDGCVPESRR